MASLSISLLGAPEVAVDSRTLEVDTRKAIALLAYLAVTEQSHRRDALAALLWPDYSQERSRADLRRTVSALKKALGGRWLVAERESVGLDRGDLWLDVEGFHRRLADRGTHAHQPSEVCSLCMAPLTDAVGLHRGDFMAGFSLRDSESFDDWQFFQAEGLRRELSGALELLVDALVGTGELEPAIGHARRWLSIDPLHEPAHGQLMRLYAWSGDRGAALRQYRECVRILDRELGVAPLEETTLLYQTIKEDRLPPPAAAPRVEAGVGAAEPSTLYPLVGRSTDWRELVTAYRRIGTDGRLAVIEGEAGIGKTRLAEDFLDDARNQGAVTIATRSYEGESNLPYGPFVAALRTVIAGDADHLNDVPDRWLEEAARLAPELAAGRPGLRPTPPLDSPAAQIIFIDAVARVLLRAMQGQSPGVLLFDDLHWADEASLDVFDYLVRRLRGQPVFVVATWRSEQVPEDHRLRHLVAEARRADAATSVTLRRLSRFDVEELLRAVGIPEALGERLHAESEGLPFFVAEYIAALPREADVPGRAEWPVPSGVRDLLHSRVARVAGASRQVLSTAGVIGRSFDFDTIREASGRGEEETVRALEELMEVGLVEEVGSEVTGRAPAYDFSHEKVRALVYEETSLARRRLLHGRVADALRRGRARVDSRASLIAQHYQLAGREAEAAEYFKLAGEQARALFANAESLAHFRSALALGHPDAAGLQAAIGDLHTLRGEYMAALASYETAAALSPPDGLAALEHKIGGVHHRLGDWEAAEAHFEAALAGLEESDGGRRARVMADRSLTAARRGGSDKAWKLARGALELAEIADDSRALAQVHNIMGVLAKGRGDLDAAREHLEGSLALAEMLPAPEAKVAALNNLALVRGEAGETEEAISMAEKALALCKSQGDRHREAALHNNLADLLHGAGRSEEAMDHLKKAAIIFAEIGAETGELQPEIWKLVEW